MAQEEAAAQELAEWMSKLKLTSYLAEAEAWRKDNGAASVEEIRECQSEFCGHLQLKKLEIRRIEKWFQENPTGCGGYPSTPSTTASTMTPVSGTSTRASSSTLPGGFTHKIGTAPDEYAVYKELGSGATAKVYECRKVSAPADVRAVKQIDLKMLRMQKDFKKITQVLNREMQILLSLQHPRIVRLYDVFDNEEPDKPCDKLYLVMECMRGGELFDLIMQKGTLSEPGAQNIFCQIVDGLRHVHSKDIVYRDLKPENILIVEPCEYQEKLQIKLSDFGHSKLVNDGFSTALTRVGTPQYWAPEVQDAVAAQRGYDKNVDLWSLGIVLYVMLMGAYPFDSSKGPIETQMKNCRLGFRSPVNGEFASELARDLLTSLIKYQAKARLSLEGCLKHKWTAAAGELLQAPQTCAKYSAFHLEKKPTKNQRNEMVRDLLEFQKKFKCFTQVRSDMVVADLSKLSPEDKESSRRDLTGIIKFHLGCEPMESLMDSLAGALAPISEAEGGFMTVTTHLKVGENGAGLSLIPEVSGMRVEGVEEGSGQDNILPNDLIVKIDGHPLSGSPEMVEDIFGEHFGHGVQIQIKRRRC